MTVAVATPTRPIARCPHCGARWVVASIPHPDQPREQYECIACSREWWIEDGVFVPAVRIADATTHHDAARVRHAEAVRATTLRKRASQ